MVAEQPDLIDEAADPAPASVGQRQVQVARSGREDIALYTGNDDTESIATIRAKMISRCLAPYWRCTRYSRAA